MITRLTNKVSRISVLLVLLAITSVAVSVVHSFDVFWQLQSGRYLWETHNFIRTDLFTLTPDVPRFEHTWLHSLILYLVYSLSGYAGISVLKGLLVSATVIALITTARIRQASWQAILVVLPVFLLTSGGWLERPQLWTFLLFGLFLVILERFRISRSWIVLGLFPLAVFWANVHAGSVLALAVLAAYCVGGLGDRVLRTGGPSMSFGKLISATGLVAVAAFLTPYPGALLKTLLNVSKLGGTVDSAGQRDVSMAQAFNMDWTLTTFQNEPYFFYAMVITAVFLVLGWRRLRLIDLCLLAGLAFMGLKLVRHVPFFYMGMIAVLPVYLDAAVAPIQQRLGVNLKKVGALAVTVLALTVFFWLWRPVYATYGMFNVGLREWHYPIEATDFVEQHHLSANIYNTYDWGGYMAWQLYPDYLVFWDGRQNSAEMFNLGWNIMAGKPGWDRILANFDVNTIVTRASTIDTGQKYPLLDRLATHPDWALVFTTESSLIFVKRDSVSDTWLKRYAKPKLRMDDTILSEAHLMVSNNPRRYMAWWEMSQIYVKRKQYQNALFALKKHFAYAPPGRQVPAAEALYRALLQRDHK